MTIEDEVLMFAQTTAEFVQSERAYMLFYEARGLGLSHDHPRSHLVDIALIRALADVHKFLPSNVATGATISASTVAEEDDDAKPDAEGCAIA